MFHISNITLLEAGDKFSRTNQIKQFSHCGENVLVNEVLPQK